MVVNSLDWQGDSIFAIIRKMIHTLILATKKKREVIDITAEIEKLIGEEKINKGSVRETM